MQEIAKHVGQCHADIIEKAANNTPRGGKSMMNCTNERVQYKREHECRQWAPLFDAGSHSKSWINGTAKDNEVQRIEVQELNGRDNESRNTKKFQSEENVFPRDRSKSLREIRKKHGCSGKGRCRSRQSV